MVLGALLDTGIKKSIFLKELKKLKISEYKFNIKKIRCNGISSTYINIKFKKADKGHRTFFDIKKIIEKSRLSKFVKQKSIAVFKCLAKAESRVHRVPLKKTHFHEAGSLDNVINVVGSMICLEILSINKFCSSPLNVGKGTVKCSHGILPVPAPATKEILKGKPIFRNNIDGELTTPTGAAIITTLAKFKKSTSFVIRKTGYGISNLNNGRMNTLRVLIGTTN